MWEKRFQVDFVTFLNTRKFSESVRSIDSLEIENVCRNTHCVEYDGL